MPLFKLNSPLMQFLSKAADLMIINILWIVCSIPIITIGASTTAMYRFCLKMAMKEEDGSSAKVFFSAFRSEFKCATYVNLILLIPSAFLSINLWMLATERLNSLSLIVFACLIPLTILLAVLNYVYAYVAMFDDTPLTAIRNSFVLAMAYLPKTILMLLLGFIPVLVYLISPTFFARAIILWFLVGFSYTAYLNSRMLNKVFTKYIPK